MIDYKHSLTAAAIGVAIASLASALFPTPAPAQPTGSTASASWELNSRRLQLRPDGSFTFEVGTTMCCYLFRPANVRVAWSVEPSNGATIDAKTGVFRVLKTATPGTTFTVSARIAGSERVLTGTVTVYTRASHPLVGLWRQTSWQPCAPIPRVPPDSVDPPIEELTFDAAGAFSVTWMPFERYRDYWGRYHYDRQAGTIDLVIEHGNFVPNDFVGRGTATVAGDTLTLRRVRLGTKRAKSRPAVCELTFVRG